MPRNVSLLFALGLSAMLARNCITQFLSSTTDFIHTMGNMNISVRYKEVSGSICETTPGVKTYTGYIDVDANTHMFFWFFEARNQDPTTAPLTIWVEGGPGRASDGSIFSENGPCGITDSQELYYNPYSWNNVTNMIYIDQPVNNGFSYSTAVPGYLSSQDEIVGLPENVCPEWLEDGQQTCGTYPALDTVATPNGTIQAEDAFWRTLQGFVGAFPQYSSNGLHFSSQSYGGHYGPVYVSYILRQNAAIAKGSISPSTGAKNLDMRSLFVNNGWYDPVIQYEAYYNYTVNPGNPYGLKPFSDKAEQKMFNAFFGPGNCKDQLLQCQVTGWSDVCEDADQFCMQEVEYLLVREGYSEGDIRESEDTANFFPYFFYPTYLNQDHVLEAIGAEVNYTDQSTIIVQTFTDTGDDGRSLSTLPDLTFLYESGVYVVMYNGDADYNCNWLGAQVIANRSGPEAFGSAGYQNLQTSDDVSHGQVKQYGTFAFARIYESGHEVMFYQPLAALTMLNRTVNRKDLAIGDTAVSLDSIYRTTGELMSTYSEGGATLIDHPISPNSTYNITTNKPNPPGLRIPPSSGKRSVLNPRKAFRPKRQRTRRRVDSLR